MNNTTYFDLEEQRRAAARKKISLQSSIDTSSDPFWIDEHITMIVKKYGYIEPVNIQIEMQYLTMIKNALVITFDRKLVFIERVFCIGKEKGGKICYRSASASSSKINLTPLGMIPQLFRVNPVEKLQMFNSL